MIDLAIEKGRVRALVCGSGRNSYDVTVTIKAVRKQLGFSQFDLARRLGTNQTTISMIERGRHVSRAAGFFKALLALR